ncbi:hypothetical protein PMAYCL1PPCAC_21229 [Pristionchus mayeri]|uniref:Major facilitator superfamily (MFS) profile domain-containing protein n=1 Tax=Pristionchus mayeri TaxID=1317129 RepID=A0AAN5CUX0_9BILA|nr:hypothetical protein PMAYCL1PPCAC_21229 [Pristionchus mayeri]
MASAHPHLFSFRSHRLRVALTLMFAMFLYISNSSSLGMAIICMVNSTSHATKTDISFNGTSLSSRGCAFPVEDKANRPEYQSTIEWEPTKQSYLFSASYYGSIITVFGSGVLADRFGPKKLLLVIYSISTIVTFAAPYLAEFNYWAYYAGRFIIGMGDGFIYPCVNSLGGWWFPVTEKSTMASIYSSGIQLAAASSALIGSRLCGVEFLGGWPLIFYMYGTLGILFLICFYFVITDHPADNRWMSTEELIFLESSHEEMTRKKKVSAIPWKSIFTSPAVWACVVCSFTFSLTLSINLNFLPTYFKEEFSLPLSSNGLYTMVPFITQLICKNIIAPLADYLKRSGKLTPTQTAKIFQAISSFGSALTYVALGFLPSCDRMWVAVVCGVIFGITFSFSVCGFFTCMLTVAHAYAGTITSLSMVFGQIGYALAPNTVSFVTLMEWSYKWQIILLFGAAFQFISGIVFSLAGSGDTAPWAQSKLSMQKNMELQALKKEQR